jgi:serine/threonine protein kinase
MEVLVKELLPIKIKYEFNNLIKMVEKLDIFVDEYRIISKIRESMKKCVCVIEDKDKNKYILKAKLKDFVSECEIETYKKIQKNPHNNIIKIKKLFVSKNFFVVIYDYIDGVDMSVIKYYDMYKNNIINIYRDSLSALSYLHNLEIYHGDIKPDNIIIKKDNNKYIPIIIDFDYNNIPNSENNKYEVMLKKNKDIIKLTLTFYYYFFYKEIEKLNNIKFNTDLIENYNGEYKEFIEILGWVLKHSYELCPSIDDIINDIINDIIEKI